MPERPMRSVSDIAREQGFEIDELASPEPQVSIAVNGDITVAFPDRFLRFIAQSIERRRREFNIVLTVLFKPDPARPARRLIADERMNILSRSAKTNLRMALSRRREEQWDALIEDFCAAVQDHWQPGDPAIVLTSVTDPGPVNHILRPVLQNGEHTLAFGEGGAGKSITALAIATSYATGRSLIPGLAVQQQGRTIYLDWERTAIAHKRRIAQLLRPTGAGDCPTLHYKRMVGPLSESADDIRRLKDELGISLFVVDSVGMACGGEISDEAAVIAFFNASRYIGGTWLSIAHVAKNESDGKPIGSQYWYTQPQGGAYEMLGEAEEGESTLYLTMIHRKTNDGFNPTLAWHVDFSNEAIQFRAANAIETTARSRKLPVAMRIADVLGKSGALTAAEIAQEIEVSPAAVTTALKRNPSQFVLVGAGRPQRWGRKASKLAANYQQLSANTGGKLSGAAPLGGGPVNANFPVNPHLSKKDDPPDDLPWTDEVAE